MRPLIIALLFSSFAFAGEPKATKVKIPDGTRILATLDGGIASNKSKVGDAVTLTVIEDTAQAKAVLVPKKAKLSGKISEVAKLKTGESRIGIWVTRAKWESGGEQFEAALEAFIVALGSMGKIEPELAIARGADASTGGSADIELVKTRTIRNQEVSSVNTNSQARPAGALELQAHETEPIPTGNTARTKRVPKGLSLKRASTSPGSVFISSEEELDFPLGTELLLRHGLPPEWKPKLD